MCWTCMCAFTHQCHALSLAEACVWFRVVWSVNDRILFRDFYWRSQLLLLPASGLDIRREEQPKTPLRVSVCALTACLSSFPSFGERQRRGSLSTSVCVVVSAFVSILGRVSRSSRRTPPSQEVVLTTFLCTAHSLSLLRAAHASTRNPSFQIGGILPCTLTDTATGHDIKI
jgi:hypothetical protein